MGRNVVKIWIDVLIIIDIAEILLKLALNTNQSLIPFQRLQLLFDNSEEVSRLSIRDCPFRFNYMYGTDLLKSKNKNMPKTLFLLYKL